MSRGPRRGGLQARVKVLDGVRRAGLDRIGPLRRGQRAGQERAASRGREGRGGREGGQAGANKAREERATQARSAAQRSNMGRGDEQAKPTAPAPPRCRKSRSPP